MSDVNEDSLIVVGGRKRGRPRAEEQSNSVSTWLPVGAHDALVRLAKREEKSISSLVRELLILRIPKR